MNKGELTKAVASASGLSQSDAGKAVDALFDTVAAAVKSRQQVAIAGFGTFSAKTRNAREGRNPATKETIKIPEKTSMAFKPASALKDI
ncbi:HU family DNA-binding protein [Hyphomonas sp.]|jgi:DNA-binding protein HU-beta|uniref:HU family DNA-binding protein n=1 Tax=Hyphomonas sp. TaxID=87 RepID=UPI001BCB6FA4|nr:HU family DNA-binding protein [Hyphomonas sp.]